MKRKPSFTLVSAIVLAVLLITLAPAPAAGTIPAPDPQGAPLSPDASLLPQLWASNWTDIVAGGPPAVFTHNMGGNIEDYSVQLWFRDTADPGLGLNNVGYGTWQDPISFTGAYWYGLTPTEIRVQRMPNEPAADQVRVWIWRQKPPLAQYCKPWTALAPGTTMPVTHGLGGSVGDYVVKLWFRDTDPNPGGLGVHQFRYGGADVLEPPATVLHQGAYWHNLTDTQVSVTRGANDDWVDEFYLCVIKPAEQPDWDSGWQPIQEGQALPLPYPHPMANPNRYVVRTEFMDQDPNLDANLGIHNRAYGGDWTQELSVERWYGAAWQNLTNTGITVYRWPQDDLVDQVRVRIWRRRVSAYLPVVRRR